MVYYITKAIHWAFLAYTCILLGNIIGSWFPRYSFHPMMRLVRRYSDPYLNVFRRIIPPIGGTLDLSPMLGFFALQMLEKMLLGFVIAVF